MADDTVEIDVNATGHLLGAYKSAAKKTGCTLEQWLEHKTAGRSRCTACKAWKQKNQFHADKTRRSGHQHVCIDCTINRHRRCRYQVSNEQIAALDDKVCPICNRTGQKMEIDHNHTTGKVRGFLCSRCNGALGQFCDDVRLLETAIKYLEKHDV